MEYAIINGSKAQHPHKAHPCFEMGRESLNNRFVYLAVSPRARGLTVGVNLSPDRRCNFDCLYCDVTRKASSNNGHQLDVDVLARELEQTLAKVQQGKLRQLECFRNLPDELLTLRQVEISGDGEPTLCPQFSEALQTLVHIRAKGQFPFFKLTLLTNASLLNQANVQEGLRFLLHQDEVWVKLDGGSDPYLRQVNQPSVSLRQLLDNILSLARQRPVVIQSLFPLLNGQEPPDTEITAYAQCLCELKEAGAQIDQVQIYSASRPSSKSGCDHLALRCLSRIAHTVRSLTHLPVEVF